jgi:Tfp pilus assembly protein PilF
VFDNLTALGEHTAAKAAIDAGRQRSPKAAYMWLKSAENATVLGNKALAADYFKQALLLATEEKDDALVKVIQSKMGKP